MGKRTDPLERGKDPMAVVKPYSKGFPNFVAGVQPMNFNNLSLPKINF